MIQLILSILSSAAIAVLMRLGDKQIKNNMVMFASNYIVCGVMSWAFMQKAGEAASGTGSGFALGLGIIGGIMFLLSFVLLQFNIGKNGVVLASTFMKLGVMVPILMAVVVFGEDPGRYQLLGILLAIIAIIVINGEKSDETVHSKSEKNQLSGKIWLIILLISGGFTDSLSNIYDKIGSADYKNQYLLVIFAVATVLSIVMAVVKKQRFTWVDAAWGIAIGIPNYFSARCVLYALASLPAIVVYPVYNVATILIVSLVGIFVFKENLSKRKLCGLVMIAVAIILLNL